MLTGYLLEKLCNEGILRGKVSVDRNFIPNMGGHSWVRYTSKDGEVFILDSANNFIGRIEDAGEYRSIYERPPEPNNESPVERFYKGIVSGLRNISGKK